MYETVGTGYIELDEFCQLVRAKMQEDEDERELKEIFRVLDKDKRGEVCISRHRRNKNVFQS